MEEQKDSPTPPKEPMSPKELPPQTPPTSPLTRQDSISGPSGLGPIGIGFDWGMQYVDREILALRKKKLKLQVENLKLQNQKLEMEIYTLQLKEG
ncbi:hypothetical protein SNE40_018685 [Patella caerulea]|uniref:Uncharacterized protein n=1 Tax=Patella caerulea TaxID=87958 RepID=A0AAN8PCK9_PATCE